MEGLVRNLNFMRAQGVLCSRDMSSLCVSVTRISTPIVPGKSSYSMSRIVSLFCGSLWMLTTHKDFGIYFSWNNTTRASLH
jgi:hypothetical protein